MASKSLKVQEERLQNTLKLGNIKIGEECCTWGFFWEFSCLPTDPTLCIFSNYYKDILLYNMLVVWRKKSFKNRLNLDKLTKIFCKNSCKDFKPSWLGSINLSILVVLNIKHSGKMWVVRRQQEVLWEFIFILSQGGKSQCHLYWQQ